MPRTAAILALALVAAPLLARAPRQTDAERLQQRLAALVPGKPASCITQRPNNNSETYDGVVVYEVAGTTYVNRFDGSCDLRRDFDTLITSTPTTQLCRGDIAQVVSTGVPIPRGTCIYGTFETYTRPKKVK